MTILASKTYVESLKDRKKVIKEQLSKRFARRGGNETPEETYKRAEALAAAIRANNSDDDLSRG